MKRLIQTLFATLVIVAVGYTPAALAATPAEIDADVDKAIQQFKEQVQGGDTFLAQAQGYLVFPRVIKVGIGVGAETGEGALRIAGESADYYRTTSGSIGFQLGAQAKSVLIVFMTPESLQKFRNSNGWQVGVDGSVALIDLGAGKSIDSTNIKDPVVGFIYGAKGLMYNLTLEGTKIHKLDKS